MSNNQIKKAGDAIRKGKAGAKDWETFDRFRAAHVPALVESLNAIKQILRQYPNATLSGRLKNVATICAKLKRGTQLHKMQDIAGIRVVVDGGRKAQDLLCCSIRAKGVLSNVHIEDRRLTPQSGYHALHLIGQRNNLLVEVQIRTHQQHNWAQMFERMADVFGRQIRYDEPASPGPGLSVDGAVLGREEVIEEAKELARSIADSEVHENDIAVDDELRRFRAILESLSSARSDRQTQPPPEDRSEWYLVIYDRLVGHCIAWQALSDEQLAAQWHKSESLYRGNDNIEVVLLAGSIHDLRRTHERYFTPLPGVSAFSPQCPP